MNPVVVVHLLVACVTVVVSIPLIRRKVKMNQWYGIRIPAAFESDEAWFALNRYGGWLFLAWGLANAATAGIGALLEPKDWLAYDWTALVVIMAGLLVVVVKIHRYARMQKRP